MGRLEATFVRGAACDVRGCDVEELLTELVPSFGIEERAFEARLLAAGWVVRVTRSRRLYCPRHASLAARCPRECTGQPNRYCRCPVHGSGLIIDAAGTHRGAA